ncbi:NAD-dependent 4,6-dehydratase LegB [Syntrophaceticus schinkii]|uniref:NAD dependent epimerase/dehydratase family protein n=1 Tax=Syntrophaceticus schinkii TaxID=499207 RepID=A0A0B7MBA6_9FIRM|nr:NAD-dependent 4,6-dehydratase LegB [Syntrophaceticus schinkii]CEO87779.1 NAD dependent epimerase/dehydratase family protein [Syntrophaceticus schinkii]
MRILVTGSGGFIGSHLTERLVQEGYDVRAFLHYNSLGHWGWLEESSIRNQIDVYLGDIRDYDSVRDAVKGVNIIFHLAALIGIPYSYKSPLAYIKTNIEGTYNVLQAALDEGCSRVVHTSTSEVYGTAQYVPIDEEHPLHAQSPYAATKISADQLALSFFRSFNLPVVVARPFNTYGPRQSARAIIPTVITQVLSRVPEIKLGNLSPTRDFNYVKDTVSGFLAVAFSEHVEGEVINIGSGVEISIGDLVQLISKIIGIDANVVQEKQRVRPGKSEVERLLCDNKKVKQLTDWETKYSLEEGLKETVEWIKNNLEKYKPGIYNV